jgi:hypothetical protein
MATQTKTESKSVLKRKKVQKALKFERVSGRQFLSAASSGLTAGEHVRWEVGAVDEVDSSVCGTFYISDGFDTCTFSAYMGPEGAAEKQALENLRDSIDEFLSRFQEAVDVADKLAAYKDSKAYDAWDDL